MRFGLLPRDWGSRRLHSLLGLWLSLFIIFHLVTNSQAALFIGEHGKGFIHEVNLIHNIPYLPVVEIVLIGLPFLLHAGWGIKYALTAKFNASGGAGKAPRLKYGANKAYSWMRIAGYVLLVGVILHVVQMRFLDYPAEVEIGGETGEYVVRVSTDPGLDRIAERLDAKIYDKVQIKGLAADYQAKEKSGSLSYEIEGAMVAALEHRKLARDEVMVMSNSSGKAILFTVRNVMKSWTMRVLYSIFVLAGVYHGFRGLWSFSIVWGIALTKRSQHVMRWVSVSLMVVVGLLGMAAIWLTSMVTLR
jgi:succinate dehydrogenase cytochrome b subunit